MARTAHAEGDGLLPSAFAVCGGNEVGVGLPPRPVTAHASHEARKVRETDAMMTSDAPEGPMRPVLSCPAPPRPAPRNTRRMAPVCALPR